MPYIRVDVEVRSDECWQLAPAPIRAKAKALYIDAISYSCELLTDGHVPHSVMTGLSHELGIERPQKVMRFLVDSERLSITKTGFFVIDWEHFHDSRETVQRRRTDAAKRKRASRAQTSLPLSRTLSQRDRHDASQRDTERDSCAHARTQAAVAVTAEDSPRAVDLDQADDDEPDVGTPSTNGAGGLVNGAPDERTAREIVKQLTPELPDITF